MFSMISTWQMAQTNGLSQDPRQSVIIWSTLYSNFETQNLIQSVWIRRFLGERKLYELQQFILEQKISEITVWCKHFVFSKRPNLLLYRPIGKSLYKRQALQGDMETIFMRWQQKAEYVAIVNKWFNVFPY